MKSTGKLKLRWTALELPRERMLTRSAPLRNWTNEITSWLLLLNLELSPNFSPDGMDLTKSLRLCQIGCLSSNIWSARLTKQCILVAFSFTLTKTSMKPSDSKKRLNRASGSLQLNPSRIFEKKGKNSKSWLKRLVSTNQCGNQWISCTQMCPGFYEPSWTLKTFLPLSDQGITLYGCDCNNVRNNHFCSFPSGFRVLVGMHLTDAVPQYCRATDVFWSLNAFQTESI